MWWVRDSTLGYSRGSSLQTNDKSHAVRKPSIAVLCHTTVFPVPLIHCVRLQTYIQEVGAPRSISKSISGHGVDALALDDYQT
jgi:hypothetical protein